MSLKKLALALAVAIAMSAGAFAAETKIGTLMYFKVGAYNLGEGKYLNSSLASKQGFTANPQIDRIRLNVNTKVNDVWDVNFTFNTNTTGYVEFAYAQAKVADGFKLSFGIIPVVELVTIDAPRDMRWISSPILYRGGSFGYTQTAGANTAMYSGTLGARADISIAKMINIAAMIDSGEGQGIVADGTVSTAAVALNVQVKLIEKLLIGVFGRAFLGHDLDYAQEKFWYAGAGVAWNDKALKVGTNWAFKSYGYSATLTNRGYTAGELYLNYNLKEAASIPLLIIAQVTLRLNQTIAGIVEGKAATDSSGLAGLDFTVGVGYDFDGVKLALCYTGTPTQDVTGAAGVKALKSDVTIQAEVKY